MYIQPQKDVYMTRDEVSSYQRHAPATSSTKFSLDFEVSNRGTITALDALCNSAFQHVLGQGDGFPVLTCAGETQLT
jgi:hypothetical protein